MSAVPRVTDEMIAVASKAYMGAHASIATPADRWRDAITALLPLIVAPGIPEQPPNPDQITIFGCSHGETAITMGRAAYEKAKATGMLDLVLDAELSAIDEETFLVEPDGTRIYPFRSEGMHP